MEKSLFPIIREKQEPTQQQLIYAKKEEYMTYIENHINNVKIAYNNIKNFNFPNTDIVDVEALKQAIILTEGNISIHDQSKYSDEEFEPYRKNFYPISEEEKKMNEEDFEIAWKHHYTVNPHHPEHYIQDDGYIKPMGLVSIIEMICDWDAMSMQQHSSTEKWYYNAINNNAIKFNPDTKKIVDFLMLRRT